MNLMDQLGAGVIRAAERLAAIRASHPASFERPMSRQQRRAEARRYAKDLLSFQKSRALKNAIMGGAAAVR